MGVFDTAVLGMTPGMVRGSSWVGYGVGILYSSGHGVGMTWIRVRFISSNFHAVQMSAVIYTLYILDLLKKM